MTYPNDRQANLVENVIFTLTNFSFAVLSDPFRSVDLCTVGDLYTKIVSEHISKVKLLGMRFVHFVK